MTERVVTILCAAALVSCSQSAGLGAGAPSSRTDAKGPASLLAYVGKYPFDDVAGVSWNAHPAVSSAVRGTVADAAVRRAIAATPGPAAPIELIDGKVSAWACQAHNCGDHQWRVTIDPESGTAEVCYHHESATPRQSRWYLAGSRAELRDGNCLGR